VRLTELARLETGHTPSRRVPAYWEGGTIPWIGIRDATAHHGQTLYSTNQYITEAGEQNSSTRLLPAGTVCLSRTASVGYVVVMGVPMCTSQDFVNWVCGPELDHRYLKYILLAEKDSFLRFASGTTHQTIYFPEVKAFHVLVPSITEQRAVAAVLGALDDKIELNRRMSETLDTMARALFKSWFVDFDPVRAKAEGRDIGLPAEIADLFPDQLVDSPLGPIPKGWSSAQIADFTLLNPESWSKATRPTTIRYVDLSNTKWGRIESVVAIDSVEAPSRAQRVLRPGDTIVGTVRPGNGSYALVSAEGLTGSTGFAALRPLGPEFREFVYLAATSALNIERLAHLADGAAYPAVRPDVVTATTVVRPPNKVMSAFSAATGLWLTRIAAGDTESRLLLAAREAMLPRLVSGELRVPDVDRVLERAGS
jgi:type I restriction enzyme S subunit